MQQVKLFFVMPSPSSYRQAHYHYCCYSIIVRLFKLFLLFCSVLSGVLFAVVWRNYEQTVLRIASIHSPSNVHRTLHSKDWKLKLDTHLQQPSNSYEKWLQANGLESIKIRHEDLSYGNVKTSDLVIESEFLANRTKVLCMILSSTRTKSRALDNTWTRHCNQRIFYGSYYEMKIPYVKLKLLDDSLLSPRTFCVGFIDLLNRADSDYQWLLIVTDQTYAIIENLRYLVTPLDYRKRFYIGRPVNHYFLGVYNSYDSGIVLSRGSVDLLANTVFLPNQSSCVYLPTNGMVYGGQFDSYIGMHLAKYGIRPENSYDNPGGKRSGGSRFHPFMPEKHLNPQMISVFDTYWMSNLLPMVGGFSCCSDRAITFTGFSPITMYFIEYVLYHLAAFTQFDGPLGLGNYPPPYQSYEVPSDLDINHEDTDKLLKMSTLFYEQESISIMSTKVTHHHQIRINHRKRRKHRNKKRKQAKAKNRTIIVD